MIITKGLKPHKVLMALYDRARPQGMGLLQYRAGSLDDDEAKKLLKEHNYFDYLNGRVMKVSLKDPNIFDERLYDRDNGYGAAQDAIDSLKKEA